MCLNQIHFFFLLFFVVLSCSFCGCLNRQGVLNQIKAYQEVMNDSTLIDDFEMKPSIHDSPPQNYLYFSNTLESSSSESEPDKRNSFANVSSPSTLTSSATGRNIETCYRVPSVTSTPLISSPVISFSNSNPMDCNLYEDHGVKKTSVETAVETSQMINFGSMESASSIGSIEYAQPTMKSGGFKRTASQAKYHMMAERKRREKLLQQFIALSAIVPGLQKLNKISIMEGAIDHIKHLRNRHKTLTDWANYRTKHDESCSLSSDEDIRIQIEHSWNDIQIKVANPDVLIRVTCENRTNLQEEDFIREMNNLNLSVTNSRFMPFGDDKLVLSAVAKMHDGFCMTDEELEDRMRLSILKLIII